MVGSLCKDGVHLHACLSDDRGSTVAGHVVGGLEVFTTMEVMLGEPLDQVLSRTFDPKTGFAELVVTRKNP